MTEDPPGRLTRRLWPESALRLVELLAAGRDAPLTAKRAAAVGATLRAALAELARLAEDACGLDAANGPPAAHELAAVAGHLAEVLAEALPAQVDDLAETLAVAGLPLPRCQAIAAEWASRVELATAQAFEVAMLAAHLGVAPLLPDFARGGKVLAAARDGGRAKAAGEGYDRDRMVKWILGLEPAPASTPPDSKAARLVIFQAVVDAARAEDAEVSSRELFRKASARLLGATPAKLAGMLLAAGLSPERAQELATWWCSRAEKHCSPRTLRRWCTDPAPPHPRKN